MYRHFHDSETNSHFKPEYTTSRDHETIEIEMIA